MLCGGQVEWIRRYGDDTHFGDYDLDGDGVIDADEWMQSRQADREFRSVDVDHDGKVLLEEWIAKYSTLRANGSSPVCMLQIWVS